MAGTFTYDAFIETGGTEAVSSSVISLEADLAEQRLILCTAGWLTSESCFGNWNKLIPVPLNEPCAVVDQDCQ